MNPATNIDLQSAKILGIGTDLAEVDRIEQSIVRYGDRFVKRIYTPGEIAYVSRKANRFERFAARFAAKEAGMKALGTGWSGGVRWQDFEVANLRSGRPTLKLHGKAAEYAAAMGARHVHLSLTHTSTMAMAVVILEA
jgi:holo-[acyl-carrier protein] synthase